MLFIGLQVLATLLLSPGALASDASLLIYVSDSAPGSYELFTPTPVLTRSEFNETAALIKGYLPEGTSLYSLYLTKREAKNMTSDWLFDVLQTEGWVHSQKISSLTIVSHGNSYFFSEVSHLGSLGTLSRFGPRGNFRKLLGWLKPLFSTRLHIQLKSCSVLCGSKTVTQKKSKALFDFISTDSAVKELSLWGPKNALLGIKDNGTRISRESRRAGNKTLRRSQIASMVLFPIVFGSIGYGISEVSNAATPLPDILIGLIVGLGAGGLYSSFAEILKSNLLHSLYEGLWVRVSSRSISIEETDYFGREAQIGSLHNLRCSSFLGP